MKRNNSRLPLAQTLTLLALGTFFIACKPTQKDPPLNYNHNRLDAKVEELKIAKDSPLGKIGISDLWKKTTGKNPDGSRVRIAVVGTGIDYTIPDLRDALAINLGEFSQANRENGIDDDR